MNPSMDLSNGAASNAPLRLPFAGCLRVLPSKLVELLRFMGLSLMIKIHGAIYSLQEYHP